MRKVLALALVAAFATAVSVAPISGASGPSGDPAADAAKKKKKKCGKKKKKKGQSPRDRLDDIRDKKREQAGLKPKPGRAAAEASKKKGKKKCGKKKKGKGKGGKGKGGGPNRRGVEVIGANYAGKTNEGMDVAISTYPGGGSMSIEIGTTCTFQGSTIPTESFVTGRIDPLNKPGKYGAFSGEFTASNGALTFTGTVQGNATKTGASGTGTVNTSSDGTTTCQGRTVSYTLPKTSDRCVDDVRGLPARC